MSIGASNCSIKVDRAERKMQVDGQNWFRQLLNLTITGHSPTVGTNLALFAFRRGVLVATGASMSGGTTTATGTMDTNTTEMETAMDGVEHGAAREIVMFLWDADVTSTELLARGSLFLRGVPVDYADDSGADPVSPVTPTTIKVGIFAFYNGQTYGLNSADGLYYRITFDGQGEQIHWHFEEAGISIP